MPLKDILVHLDASARSAVRLDLAIDLARRHDAHLTALHVVDIGLPLIAMGDGGGAAVAGLIDQMRDTALADAAGIEAAYRERIRRDSLPGEWRQAEGQVSEVGEQGRLSRNLGREGVRSMFREEVAKPFDGFDLVIRDRDGEQRRGPIRRHQASGGVF